MKRDRASLFFRIADIAGSPSRKPSPAKHIGGPIPRCYLFTPPPPLPNVMLLYFRSFFRLSSFLSRLVPFPGSSSMIITLEFYRALHSDAACCAPKAIALCEQGDEAIAVGLLSEALPDNPVDDSATEEGGGSGEDYATATSLLRKVMPT